MPNYGDEYEKAKIAAGYSNEAQFQRGPAPDAPYVGQSVGIGKSIIRDDAPTQFVTMGTVYEHLNMLHKQLLETEGMARALCEKLDGTSNQSALNGPVSQRRDPTNVVEAIDERVTDIENMARIINGALGDACRRVL